jgi:phage gp29-like protein
MYKKVSDKRYVRTEQGIQEAKGYVKDMVVPETHKGLDLFRVYNKDNYNNSFYRHRVVEAITGLCVVQANTLTELQHELDKLCEDKTKEDFDKAIRVALLTHGFSPAYKEGDEA